MSPEDRQKLDVWLGPIYLPYKPNYLIKTMNDYNGQSSVISMICLQIIT